MKVPKNKYDSWNRTKEHGDIIKISKSTGLTLFIVRNALNGIASVPVIKKIDAFYNKRKKQAA